jgi:hypothetical protein
MSFYAWLREGVKQAVLLGVSDAVEALGAPATQETLNPELAALLKPGQPQPALAGAASIATPRPQVRKRLGRSLGDLSRSESELS